MNSECLASLNASGALVKTHGVADGDVRLRRRTTSMLIVLSAAAFFHAAPNKALGYEVGPCSTANSDCTEWIGADSGQHRVMIYRSHPLSTKNENVTRALIVVHGGSRNAVESFNSASAAAFLAGRLNDTVLVAPRFGSNTGTSCRDALSPLEANWGCEDRQPDSWRNGSAALNDDKITSFDLVDEIFRKLGRKDTFPNLKSVVIAGHSGGGQFALRYAMASDAPDSIGLATTFVVSNPDAVVYFDHFRPTAAAYPATAGAPGFARNRPQDLFLPFADARNCTSFDSWPYGLENRTGHSARWTAEQLQDRLTTRQVVYLLGGLDVFPAAGLDDTCPAMAQGPTRLARGLAFGKYLNERYGAHHRVLVMPTCGHDERCLFTSYFGLVTLFPRQQ